MKRKSIKLFIKLLLLLITIFPTALIYNSVVTNLQDGTNPSKDDESIISIRENLDPPQISGPDIPNATHIDPRNEWTWHDDVDINETMIFKMSFIMENLSSSEVRAMKFLNIINITAFGNSTFNFMGEGQEMSQVNGTLLLWNYTTNQLEPIPGIDPFQIALFGYNKTHPYFHEKYAAIEEFSQPVLLPVNGSKTTATNMAVLKDIIYYTYILPAFNDGHLCYFNTYSTSDASDNHMISFQNTTDGYYWDWYFYDNGTLKYAEGSYLAQGEPGELDNLVNITIRRVFDYNLTDEVQWGVDIGDELYFGRTDECDNGLELKLIVSAINTSQIYADMFIFGSGGYMPFQIVYVNVSSWNFTLQEWEPLVNYYPIAMANNLWPYMPNVDDGFLFNFTQFIVKKNTRLEDWQFLLNNKTVLDMGGSEIIYTINDDEFRIRMIGEDDSYEMLIIIDNSTGINKLWRIGSPMGKILNFRKNTTTILSPNNLTDYWLYSDLVPAWKIYINATINKTHDKDYETFWAILPENPINVPFAYELPEAVRIYIDLYINDSMALEPINLTIHYDGAALAAAGINEKNLCPYGYDLNTRKWLSAPSSYYEINTTNDVLIIYFPEEGGPGSNFFAIGYKKLAAGAAPLPAGDDDDDDEEEIIPGYDTSILIVTIALLSVVIILNRRKKFKISKK